MHNINFHNGKYSFVSSAEKAWHGLGKSAMGLMTIKQVVEECNMDYTVAMCPLEANIPNSLEPSSLDGKYVTYRTDNHAALGVVSKNYELVQNAEAFDFFDSIIDRGEAIFETAGVLGKGEKVFVTAKLPSDFRVNGDECNMYLLLTTSHDGSSSVIAGFTPIRVVCNNTLVASLKSLKNSVNIPHFRGAKEKIALAAELMNISSVYTSEVNDIFEQFSKVKMSDEKIKNYISDVLRPETPVKELNDEEQIEKTSTRFNNLVEKVYTFALSHPTQTTKAAEGTLWGAYNSVSGYFNFRNDYKSPEHKFRSISLNNGYANRKINKAFEKAFELI